MSLNKVDEIISTSHPKYTEFERAQFIISIPQGYKLTITLTDPTDKVIENKEFVSKHINTHINCQWQDKGEKNNE